MALLRQLPDSVLREDAPTLCKKFKTVKTLLRSDYSLFAPLTYKEAKSVKLRVARTSAPFALTGLQVYRDFIQEASVIPTGVIGIDRLLKGGLSSGQVVEIFGRSGTGKSELCHRLSANAALSSKKAVLYLQTKGDFRPEKMQEILQQLNRDVKAVTDALKCILVMDLSSLDELLVALTTVAPSTAPRVVVIDSLAALVNSRLDATMATLSRLQTLAHCMRRLAADHNLTVVLVNHQVGSAEGVPRAAMGTLWQSVPNVRIFLNRRQITWTATLTKSPSFKTQTVCVEF